MLMSSNSCGLLIQCLIAVLNIQMCWMYGPPVVSKRLPKFHVARFGHNTKIPCPVESDSDAFYQWYKDMQIIGGGWERFEVMNKGLKIRDVIFEDAGIYRCTVTNGFGSAAVNITMKVIDANSTANFNESPGIGPVFVHPEKFRKEPILRPVGNNIRLKCKAKGKPRPTVSWFKQVDGEWRETQGFKKTQWTLELANLHKGDTGKYLCRVENHIGYVNYTFELNVMEREMMKPELVPPHPINTTVKYGNTASFQCKVRSDVQPHIMWLKKLDSNTPVTQPNQTIKVNGMSLHVLKKGEVWLRKDGSYLNKLIIHQARMEDAGMYVCLGANNRGYNYKEAYLIVTPDPNAELMDRQTTKTVNSSSSLDYISNYSLIIGIPIAVFFIIIIIVIVVRRKCAKKPQKTPAKRYAPPAERMMKNYDPDLNSQSDINTSNMQRMYTQTPQHTMYGEC